MKQEDEESYLPASCALPPEQFHLHLHYLRHSNNAGNDSIALEGG